MSTYIFVGFVLDYLLGDPTWLPHPIRLIGRFISGLEKIIRKMGLGRHGLKVAGVFLVLLTAGLTYGIVSLLMYLALGLSAWVFAALCSIIIFYTLAARNLADEARKVYLALEGGDLVLARKRLSYLVSRDTQDLSEEQIIRGTVETVAENSVDGVLAPLFYLFLGGPALGMAYKAVSTLDSMVGYLNDDYRDLGWASAKLDDLLNWLPARIAGFLIPIAGGVWGKDTREGLRVYFRDKRKHKSPNSGHPEAAMAGVLGIRLGGSSRYFGKLVEKPDIGDATKVAEKGDILAALHIMKTAAFLGLVMFYVIFLKFGFR